MWNVIVTSKNGQTQEAKFNNYADAVLIFAKLDTTTSNEGVGNVRICYNDITMKLANLASFRRN